MRASLSVSLSRTRAARGAHKLRNYCLLKGAARAHARMLTACNDAEFCALQLLFQYLARIISRECGSPCERERVAKVNGRGIECFCVWN